MCKNTHYSEPMILNQLIMFLDKRKVIKIAIQNESDRNVKKSHPEQNQPIKEFEALDAY